jgi:hypothetical protein
MTPLAQCFNAPKKDCSMVSATGACHDGMSAEECFFATLVSPLRALQIP